MNAGTPHLDEAIHFHCVSTSTDPDDSKADTYFDNIEDAKAFAEIQAAKYAAVWLWERGKIVGRPGYEDVWIAYWWNNLLAKDYGYGPTEGRGRGWVNWMAGPLPTDLGDSTCEYIPLEMKARSPV